MTLSHRTPEGANVIPSPSPVPGIPQPAETLFDVTPFIDPVAVERHRRDAVLKAASKLNVNIGEPWMTDDEKHWGDNWPIARFGLSDEENRHVIVCLDHVRASECGEHDAAWDASFLTWCHNNWSDVLDALKLWATPPVVVLQQGESE